MTLQEFKAWFDGYTEGMDSTPNAKQWDRIKARVKEIDNVAITYPIYVERYRPYRGWVPYYASTCNTLAAGATGVGAALGGTAMNAYASTDAKTFNATSALYSTGRTDALADAA